ncbi:MAG: type VI secretion system Vgr family protein, partial [Burkholderiales bacterium]
LMEHEGIYYYFRHEQARHVLVFADAYGAHSTVADYDSVPFFPPDRQMRERDHFYDWQLEREVQPGSLELNDYDFKRPRARLEVRSSVSRSHSNGDHPLYDYPGAYVQSNDGEHYARTRIEAIHSQFERVQLRGRARGLGSGHLFKLTGYEREDQNREYLVVFARYQIRQELYESGQLDLSEQFTSELDCMDASQAFRPLPLTPMPIVRGPQTAVVVGPDGEEIWTDQYGRVKVHFYWDRHDQSNANSSCWMRVSQAWAGKNWGAVQIPRIGQEVIVSFIEGNPDRPIITGRVYNAEQTVPYTLPANATQSGVKSRSSKDGSPANFNEIRMEDKKGAEQLFIHAEKNQDIEVENDETHWVGHDRSKTIDNDETVYVKHDRTESVGNNEDISIGVNRTENVGSNETISIGRNRTISVGASETATVALQRTHAVGINETIAIGAAQEVVIGAFQTVNVGAYQNVNVGLYQSTNVGANRSVDVGANLSTTVKENESRRVGAGRTTDIDKDDELTVGKNLVIDAGDSVTIKTGKASIVMKKDGTISISGKDITIDGSGAINIKANKNVVIKGRKILQN